jgi:hypothetical protein
MLTQPPTLKEHKNHVGRKAVDKMAMALNRTKILSEHQDQLQYLDLIQHHCHFINDLQSYTTSTRSDSKP